MFSFRNFMKPNWELHAFHRLGEPHESFSAGPQSFQGLSMSFWAPRAASGSPCGAYLGGLQTPPGAPERHPRASTAWIELQGVPGSFQGPAGNSRGFGGALKEAPRPVWGFQESPRGLGPPAAVPWSVPWGLHALLPGAWASGGSSAGTPGASRCLQWASGELPAVSASEGASEEADGSPWVVEDL